MSSKVIVHKDRTNVVTVSLGIDVSADTITSQIRSEPDVNAPLIATWEVSFKTNGADGELILRLDNTETSQIKANSGYMDLRRVVGTEPISVFDTPLEVSFRGTVTAEEVEP
ncbi:MAG: hypothetical protein ABWY25_07320 [Paenisporosarcina sp.]